MGDKARLDVPIPAGELVYSPRVPFGTQKKVERRAVAVDEALLAAGHHHGATAELSAREKRVVELI